MHQARRSGILLHPTSLPGPVGIGCLGDECRRFIDFLKETGQSLWQVLPLGPTAYGNSPYSSFSAFAGNPLLIDLFAIVNEGDITEADINEDFPADHVDFPRVQSYKLGVLKRAAEKFLSDPGGSRREDFRHFCETTSWLNDYAIFTATKEAYEGKSWRQWPEGIARRGTVALDEQASLLSPAVEIQKYMQWQFFRQWQKVKEYANQNGVEIVGDIPIFVAYDSVDVWANPHLFHLDEYGRPVVVAGVPPDYFSETGQLWGNPLYNWDVMAFQGFNWWIERMRHSLQLYDRVRIDHFRGFEAYWEVPTTEKTAINGRWVKGPGEALFNALTDSLGSLPIIVEDLGVITPDVEALRDRLRFPGMKVLQFAFGSGADNPYLPHNHCRNTVVFTGTHDNDTTVGWFSELGERERRDVLEYLDTDGNDIAWDFIRTAMSSVAGTAIIPLQDVLGLGGEARMNTPGSPDGNWAWRLRSEQLTAEVAQRLLRMTAIYGRRRG